MDTESHRFTPLNTSVTEVFMEIKRDPAFKWPAKIRGDPRRRDRTKFYEYHGDHEHLTKECISLRYEIENFIKNGKLLRFLADKRNRGQNHQGPLLHEGNREAPRAPEPRLRVQGQRDV